MVAVAGLTPLSKNHPFKRVPSAELNQTISAPSAGDLLSFADRGSGWKVMNNSNQRSPYTKATHPRTSATMAAIKCSRVRRRREGIIRIILRASGLFRFRADETRTSQMLRLPCMDKAVQLTGLTQPEMVSFVETLGEPAYRGRQLFGALQQRRLRSFDDITDLPKELRTRLNEIARAATLKVESQYLSDDGTRRYLMKTHDSLPVETVFIPEERRDTICFSSQSGCPLQCTFCLTAQLGLLRSLMA